jgi:uncharacterized protein with HEPN domain
MSRDKLRLTEYLRHILDAVDRITRYSAGMDRSAFDADMQQMFYENAT